jgi:hypothetical protein
MTATRPSGDIIDTRDLIAWRDWCMVGVSSIEEIEDEDERADVEAINEIEEAGLADFAYGETLVREDYFETYAEELAGEIGAISSEAQWPLTHIDWKAAAAELAMDYTEVEWDGATYYARA